MQPWSVTLTGTVAPGVAADMAWQRVREVLACDEEKFQHSVASRLPVSLHAEDEQAARRQWESLQVCGVEVVLLADDGRRIWVRDGERSCGPVSSAWAARAVAAGRWNRRQLACPEGEQRWRELGELLPAEASEATPAGAMPPPPPSATPGADGSATTDERLPVHARADGLHAGFWMRVAAYLIDSLILGGGAFVLMFLLLLVTGLTAGSGNSGREAGLVLLYFLFYVVLIAGAWLYFAFFEASRWQATPGKMALGLRVTDERGRRIGFGRASGRYFGKILSGMILDVGYMMAGWTARKQGLHDMVAGCCVVRRDGLQTWRTADAAASGMPRRGMPGWAIGLIVAVGVVVMVVPMMAMLAAIAVPVYQNYLIRAQVVEGVMVSSPVREAVESHYVNRHAWPADNADAELPRPEALAGTYVSSVVVHKGMVLITYGGKANEKIRGDHLLYTPDMTHGKVQWQCSSPDIDNRYLPSSCRP